MANFDDFKLAVEALSGGKNTVILDETGMPSIVVPFAKIKYSDVISGGAQEVLPAFLVGGQEKAAVYVSKYGNVIINNRAYSLALKTPAANVDFDTAVKACTSKGAGWHLMTNAIWGAIALQSQSKNALPHGNTDNGKDSNHTDEHGIGDSITATGSGPASWYTDNELAGIADLVGNLREWVSGLRIVNGEIQVIPYGNAMKYDCNMGENSTHWKAISSSGEFVEPRTAGTLKFAEYESNLIITNADSVGAVTCGAAYSTIKAADGLEIPAIVKALGLFPNGGNCPGGVCVNTSGECMANRGGNYTDGGHAGIFALDLDSARAAASAGIGFRAAYYK